MELELYLILPVELGSPFLLMPSEEKNAAVRKGPPALGATRNKGHRY